MKLPTWIVLAMTGASLPQSWAQAPSVSAEVEEAFRLAGVRAMLESLPSHANEMTAAAVAQLPREQRQQFEPLIPDVSLKLLAPDSFYRQLRTYFAKHNDADHMGTFLALERTPRYRTMNRLEESADTPESQAARRRFEANLKSDPPPAKRVEMLRRLDDSRNTTGLQVSIVIGIVNAISSGMGAQMPSDMESQSEAFKTKIRPIIADKVLASYLFTFRNIDDADLDNYLEASQQKDIAWFNRNLQMAIVAVANDRSASTIEYLKTKAPRALN